MNKLNVAFIGLGTMGYHMAGHIEKAHYPVTVFNRTTQKAEQWIDEFKKQSVNIEPALTPQLAATDADIVITCVGNDADLHEVIMGENGVIHSIKKGAIIVDHTTTSADIAREISNHLKSKKAFFIDAPVSGGEQGAINGQLTVMCGGNEEAFNKALPVMNSYAKSAILMGESGYGQLTKMMNQICIAGLVQGLAEGIHFASKAGLDIEKAIQVISKGAAQSWQMENRHQTMINDEYNHGFAVDWMRKDLGIVLDEARQNGSQLPVTALVDQFYADVQSIGGGRWDTSSLLKRLK